jgi:hypothetical protein
MARPKHECLARSPIFLFLTARLRDYMAYKYTALSKTCLIEIARNPFLCQSSRIQAFAEAIKGVQVYIVLFIKRINISKFKILILLY